MLRENISVIQIIWVKSARFLSTIFLQTFWLAKLKNEKAANPGSVDVEDIKDNIKNLK